MKIKRRGQALVELLVTMGVAAVLLPGLITGFVASNQGKAQQMQRLEATGILKEAQEATRSVRNANWSNVSTNGTYHPVVSSNSWSLSTGSATLNGYTTTVMISDVYRDTNGAIVTTGGTLDPSTKKITTTVSWSTPLPTSVSSTMYLVRMENITYSETTQSDFNNGVVNNTKVQATSPPQVAGDGEIVLSQTGGYGDWCTPTVPTCI